mgnify:CR=1 FL=1
MGMVVLGGFDALLVQGVDVEADHFHRHSLVVGCADDLAFDLLARLYQEGCRRSAGRRR